MSIHTVELPEELDSFIASSLAAGDYRSGAELIQVALRLLQHQAQDDALSTEELRRALDEGYASGPAPGGTEEIFARVRAQAGLAAKHANLG